MGEDKAPRPRAVVLVDDCALQHEDYVATHCEEEMGASRVCAARAGRRAERCREIDTALAAVRCLVLDGDSCGALFSARFGATRADVDEAARVGTELALEAGARIT